MHAFVFSRKRLTRYVRIFFALWAFDFALRVGLLVWLGPDFFLSPVNRILGNFSGVFAGIVITLLVIKRKSAKLPSLESSGSHVK